MPSIVRRRFIWAPRCTCAGCSYLGHRGSVLYRNHVDCLESTAIVDEVCIWMSEQQVHRRGTPCLTQSALHHCCIILSILVSCCGGYVQAAVIGNHSISILWTVLVKLLLSQGRDIFLRRSLLSRTVKSGVSEFEFRPDITTMIKGWLRPWNHPLSCLVKLVFRPHSVWSSLISRQVSLMMLSCHDALVFKIMDLARVETHQWPIETV